MLAGKLYNPLDQPLADERMRTQLLIKELNDTRDQTERARILEGLMPRARAGVWLRPSSYCDYGNHTMLVRKGSSTSRV